MKVCGVKFVGARDEGRLFGELPSMTLTTRARPNSTGTTGPPDACRRAKPLSYPETAEATERRSRQTFPVFHGSGAPGTIRTSDPQIRSLMLYPAELRARFSRNQDPKVHQRPLQTLLQVTKERICYPLRGSLARSWQDRNWRKWTVTPAPARCGCSKARPADPER